MAGLVTWANAWRRWSATGRSSRPRPGVGVSSPMLQSGSWRLERHRLDVEPGALGVEAGEIAHDVVACGRLVRRGAARRPRPAVLVGRPRRVVDRQRAQGPGLRLGVLEDRAAAGLDQQQLARAEPPAPDRLGGGERHGAGLGGDGDQPVAGHGEGRRPQPVAVDQRADPPAVGEDDRRRPVPRREEPGRPAAERGDVRMRRAAERRAPRGSRSGAPASAPSRSSSAARAPRRATASRSRRATAAARRPGARAPIAEPPRVGRPAADLLAVAADRVDLAVVGDRAERLGEPPDRMRVRRVALVEDRVADATAAPAGPGRGPAAGRR